MADNRKKKNRDHTASSRGTDPQRIGFSPLRISEISIISEIERRCYQAPWTRESFREILLSDTFKTYGARGSDGCLFGYVVYLEVADELHILNLAVHPDHRRKHIAERLLDHVHREALSRKRYHAFLEVRESNTVAQALYRKFGYKPIGRRKDYYPGDREAAIVMAAELEK